MNATDQSAPTPTRRRLKGRLLLALLFIGVGLLAYRAFTPRESIIAQFDSPDGDRRVVVTEVSPAGLMPSRYVYKLNVLDSAGKPLEGEGIEHNNDSASLDRDSFTVQWTTTAVALSWSDSHALAHTTNGKQAWMHIRG